MKNKTIIIDNAVRLFGESEQCDENCIEIVDDISGYHMESLQSENFSLAVICLNDFTSFEDFFMNAISSKRRSEYRRVLKEGYYVKCMSVEERNNRRDELYAINTSTDKRQGVMAEEYFMYPDEVSSFACPHHFHKTYGVFFSSPCMDRLHVSSILRRNCSDV